MSRHEIPARNPAHQVIVGWDHPMMTFFAHVIDRKKEAEDLDDYMVKWIGDEYRSVYEVDDLANKLSRYATLSPEMKATLYGDKDEGK